MRIALFVVGISSALFACGGPGSFDGTVSGVTLKPKETIFIRQPFQLSLPGQTVPVTFGDAIGVLMSDQKGICDRLKNNTAVPGGVGLAIGLAVTQGGLSVSSDLTTGSYRLINPIVDAFSTPPQGTRLMYPVFDKLDDNCQGTLKTNGQASGGTVKVESFEAGKTLTGTFDLTFGGGDGKGDFNATFCDYEVPNNATAPTCG